MDVKKAIATAKSYVRETFSDDEIVNVGLEEIEYEPDDGEWLITVGFSRPWDRPKPSPFASRLFPEDEKPPNPLNREYRIVRVKGDGTVLSVRLRNVAA